MLPVLLMKSKLPFQRQHCRREILGDMCQECRTYYIDINEQEITSCQLTQPQDHGYPARPTRACTQ